MPLCRGRSSTGSALFFQNKFLTLQLKQAIRSRTLAQVGHGGVCAWGHPARCHEHAGVCEPGPDLGAPARLSPVCLPDTALSSVWRCRLSSGQLPAGFRVRGSNIYMMTHKP